MHSTSPKPRNVGENVCYQGVFSKPQTSVDGVMWLTEAFPLRGRHVDGGLWQGAAVAHSSGQPPLLVPGGSALKSDGVISTPRAGSLLPRIPAWTAEAAVASRPKLISWSNNETIALKIMKTR